MSAPNSGTQGTQVRCTKAGCGGDPFVDTEQGHELHRAKHHIGTNCVFEGCNEAFATVSDHRAHLNNNHVVYEEMQTTSNGIHQFKVKCPWPKCDNTLQERDSLLRHVYDHVYREHIRLYGPDHYSVVSVPAEAPAKVEGPQNNDGYNGAWLAADMDDFMFSGQLQAPAGVTGFQNSDGLNGTGPTFGLGNFANQPQYPAGMNNLQDNNGLNNGAPATGLQNFNFADQPQYQAGMNGFQNNDALNGAGPAEDFTFADQPQYLTRDYILGMIHSAVQSQIQHTVPGMIRNGLRDMVCQEVQAKMVDDVENMVREEVQAKMDDVGDMITGVMEAEIPIFLESELRTNFDDLIMQQIAARSQQGNM